MGRRADESIDGWVDGWVDMSGWPWVGKGVTYGMCEKSRSYASSIACAISSLLGRQNAGGSCKSYRGFKVSEIGTGTGERDPELGPVCLSDFAPLLLRRDTCLAAAAAAGMDRCRRAGGTRVLLWP